MPNSTPATDSRPSSVPRPLMTPAPQTRENSVVSAPADSVMDEADHVIILKHCYDQRKSFKDGSKAQFWSSVKSAFIRDTGKTSAQISEIVSRLIEERRREIVDWENGFISQKPGGQVNEMLDQWIEYIKTENADIEENGMEWLDAAKKVLDADKLDQYDSSKIPHGQSGISKKWLTISSGEPEDNSDCKFK
ncbi:hypothetical protein BDZ45DRAFT_502289 [Acephala macrosclerotiorum]|nr:hypothetical protein BDZ45DRAFT_502289 [Acephala macrosclerotiorum]